MDARQKSNRRALLMLVMLEGNFAIDMDDLIIPSRYMAMMFPLCRIEVGRDVSIITAKDSQHLLTICDKTVHVICQSDMSDKITLRCLKKWQVIGEQPSCLPER